jgi:hypothetical protein
MKKLTPMKAMRKFCVECVETFQEVILCTDPDCPLYPHRFGSREGSKKTKDVIYIKRSTDKYIVGGKKMQWVNGKGWQKPEKEEKEAEPHKEATKAK